MARLAVIDGGGSALAQHRRGVETRRIPLDCCDATAPALCPGYLVLTAEESCLPEFDACYGQTAVDEECGERCMVCADVRPAIQGHRIVRRDFKRQTLGITPSGNHVPLV